MELYSKVRRSVLVEGMSHRLAARHYGLSRNTVAKMLKHSLPPGYQRKAKPMSPKLGPYIQIIDQILAADKNVLKKQRHTARRILERLRNEYGFSGGYTIVREYIATQRLKTQEVFIPLAHLPGHAQADFGETDILLDGLKTRAHYFCLSIPHADAIFIKFYPAETTEAWLDGHVSAFAWLGGIPLSILYDNSKRLVARIQPDRTRTLTKAFAQLQSHYLFEARFGRPARGNDKGKVEGMIGYARRNFMVPMPRINSFEALNAQMQVACDKRLSAVLRGHHHTVGLRLQEDIRAFMPLPCVSFEACENVSTKVSALSLVRYRNNDYSVPTDYAYQTVRICGYVDQLVISCAAQVIARHKRSYQKAQFIYNPLHYLKLLENKPNALNQAAPLQSWNLPVCFDRLRQLMEARLGYSGRREYIKVLRLMEQFDQAEVAAAVERSLRLTAISFDAVKHLLFAGNDQNLPKLNLGQYPHLPQIRVKLTQGRDYLDLLGEQHG